MVRYRNRLASMNRDRLPRLIYEWDKSLGTEAWHASVNQILQHVNMLDSNVELERESMDEENLGGLKHVDLDAVQKRLKEMDREKWWVAISDMPKLRTFTEIFDEQDYKGIVYTPLTRRQRSLVVKLKIGILALGIEKGRFTNVPLENRLCLICDDNLLDNEYHFVLYCEALKDARSKFFGEHTFLDDVEDPTDPAEICKLLLNSHNFKSTARFLEEMFRIRQEILYA